MFKDIWIIPVGILGATAIVAFIIWSRPMHGVQVIDCRMVEISPDFTTEMRELCRKARSGRI
jgi:hypothetical protein